MNVSVICPTTADRPEMLQRCIEGFLSQNYEYKKMFISFDMKTMDRKTMFFFSKTYLANLDYRVYGVDGDSCKSIGGKRNQLNGYSDTEIILHMDDDDIYKPDWITRSVHALMTSGAAIVGLPSYYSHKVNTNHVFDYSRQSNSQIYLPEATLCYWKSTWERKPFKDTSHGEGLDFISNNGKLFAHDYKEGFLATIHGGNTESYKALPIMKKVSPLEETRLLRHFYGD